MRHRELIICVGLTLLVFSCQRQTETKERNPEWYYPDGGIRTHGFEDVKNAKDGDSVTLTEYIDIKYLCMDLTETQRDICTTSLTSEPGQNIEIKLPVCSDERRRNCIFVGNNPGTLDFHKVYIQVNDGKRIDFWKLIEPPNSWMCILPKLRFTGRVTVVDGEGRLLQPIEKIEVE